MGASYVDLAGTMGASYLDLAGPMGASYVLAVKLPDFLWTSGSFQHSWLLWSLLFLG